MQELIQANPGFEDKKIWAIGGGKGGVGKSFISSSLAVCLGRLEQSVTVVDFDLGSANLHTCLGAPIPKLSLSDFLSGRVQDFCQLETPTGIKGVHFVSGFNDALNISNITEEQKNALLVGLKQLKSKFVLIDLGAGTHNNTLDFFLSAHKQILATVPEPTSIENTYRFIKASFYRQLRILERELGLQDIIEKAMDHRNDLGIRTPSDLIQFVQKSDPEKGQMFARKIENTKMNLILNQIRTRTDIELGKSMQNICRKYFAIELEFAGYLDYDNAVWQALRKKRPVLVEAPYSTLVGQFLRITRQLGNIPQYGMTA